jgi:diguanylate cyclase (GGDEF)-like protein
MTESAYARAVARVVGATAAFGALGLAITIFAMTKDPIPSPIRFSAAMLAIVAADLGLVSIRRGGSSHGRDWDEAGWVIALLLVPSSYVVIMSVVIGLVVNSFYRRPAKKILFNCSIRAIAGTVAMFIVEPGRLYQTHLDWNHAFRAAQLPWLLIGTMAIALLHLSLTSFVVGAERGHAPRSFVASMIRPSLANWFRNVIAGLVIAAGLAISTTFTVVALAALVVLHFFLAERLEIKQERVAWKRLHTATEELRAVDLELLMREATTAAAVMMKADAAEIQLDERTGVLAVVRASDEGALENLDQPDNGPQHSLDVQLTTHEGPIGELRLLFTQPVVLTETEQSCLAAFGNALSVALANALKFDEMKEEAERRVRAAYRDPVTGVGNLLMLEEEARTSIADLEPGNVLVVVVIGLSRFAEVNDLLGAHAADQMLKAVAERLRGLVRRSDIVARLHGAEFVLLLRDLSSVAAGEAQAALVARALHMPVHADGLDMTVDAHTGLASAPNDGDSVEELVRRARLAMYQARTKDLPVFSYQPELEPPALAQVELLNDLSAALVERQLILHYQPKMSLRSGQPVAAEALVRWQHPQRGLIPPTEFIPLLERCGLVGDLTRYVLEASIKECAAWRKMGMPLAIAVNLSARNLLDEDLPRFVLECLSRYDVPADRLICEITETAVFSRSPIAMSVLDQLRGAGISLSLDDFCTGYSSLSLLRERTIDEIKIDRSFVSDLGIDNRTTQIVTALIELAHRCDIIVTAEGIETPEQEQILTTLGCDLAQGFLLAMPMPSDEVRTFFTDAMANSNTRPSTPPRRALRSADSIGRWDDELGWQRAVAE